MHLGLGVGEDASKRDDAVKDRSTLGVNGLLQRERWDLFTILYEREKRHRHEHYPTNDLSKAVPNRGLFQAPRGKPLPREDVGRREDDG
jgi:hypothetical protein